MAGVCCSMARPLPDGKVINETMRLHLGSSGWQPVHEQRGADRDRGDLLFAEQFADFHLKLEWRISEGGNSGALPGRGAASARTIYKSAPEMQVLDNDRHPDAKMGALMETAPQAPCMI